MSRELSDSELLELEAMVDRTALSEVVLALAGLAYDKADHISANWQDEGLATVWHRAGDRLVRTGAALRDKMGSV